MGCKNFSFLSMQERVIIKKLLNQGETFTGIGKAIMRTRSTVAEEVARYGGRKDYDPNVANETFLKKLSGRRQCNKFSEDKNRFGERLDMLEMQLDIMIEQLKSLTNKIGSL